MRNHDTGRHLAKKERQTSVGRNRGRPHLQGPTRKRPPSRAGGTFNAVRHRGQSARIVETEMKGIKKKAWDWCSKYIRLRDALENGSSADAKYCSCCTCGKVNLRSEMDAGHFISRGMGGSSGVYFDERNIHAQCKPCNAWKQGAPHEYEQFMLDKYGQDVIDELHWLHKNGSYKGKLPAIAEMYKQIYLSLCAQHHIKP